MKLKKIGLLMFMCIFCLGLGSVISVREASADTEFKPIRGIRRTSKNTEAILQKKKVKKKIAKEKTKISSVKTKISLAEQELAAYKKVQGITGTIGTVFADNGRETELFSEVAQFDSYFKEIENYGSINENILNSESLDSSVHQNDGLYLASLVSDQVSTVTFLQSGNTEAVDISNYLEFKIYKKQMHIQKLEKKLKKEKKKIRSLRKTSKAIITNDIVFNAGDVTEVSNITVSKMRKILKGTKLEQYADVYVEIEKEYGINAIAMCALSAMESGWGESRRAIVDHNYTGFGVYSNSARGINASSGEANLFMTAKHLAKNYLKKGRMYYHGVGLDGINRSYSAAGSWAYDIEYIGMQLMQAL